MNTVNTKITKTSLSDEKQWVAQYGPGGELTGRELQLTYNGPKVDMGPSKRTPVHLEVCYL